MKWSDYLAVYVFVIAVLLYVLYYYYNKIKWKGIDIVVSNVKLTFMIISAIISIVMPVVLAIIITKKYKASFLPIVVGAGVFIIFQILFRIPLLAKFEEMDWYQKLYQNKILISLFLGLTAGMVEEIGRFIGFKILHKKKFYDYKNGIAFGIGHGGIEAILLVGLTYINNIVISSAINNGLYDSVIAVNMPDETAELIKRQLMDTKRIMFLIGGVERIFAIIIQIALTLVVLYGVKYRKNIWVFIAILLHAVIDTPIALMSLNGVNVFIIEAYTMLCAVGGLIFIIRSKRLFLQENIFYRYR